MVLKPLWTKTADNFFYLKRGDSKLSPKIQNDQNRSYIKILRKPLRNDWHNRRHRTRKYYPKEGNDYQKHIEGYKIGIKIGIKTFDQNKFVETNSAIKFLFFRPKYHLKRGQLCQPQIIQSVISFRFCVIWLQNRAHFRHKKNIQTSSNNQQFHQRSQQHD